MNDVIARLVAEFTECRDMASPGGAAEVDCHLRLLDQVATVVASDTLEQDDLRSACRGYFNASLNVLRLLENVGDEQGTCGVLRNMVKVLGPFSNWIPSEDSQKLVEAAASAFQLTSTDNALDPTATRLLEDAVVVTLGDGHQLEDSRAETLVTLLAFLQRLALRHLDLDRSISLVLAQLWVVALSASRIPTVAMAEGIGESTLLAALLADEREADEDAEALWAASQRVCLAGSTRPGWPSDWVLNLVFRATSFRTARLRALSRNLEALSIVDEAIESIGEAASSAGDAYRWLMSGKRAEIVAAAGDPADAIRILNLAVDRLSGAPLSKIVDPNDVTMLLCSLVMIQHEFAPGTDLRNRVSQLSDALDASVLDWGTTRAVEATIAAIHGDLVALSDLMTDVPRAAAERFPQPVFDTWRSANARWN